MYIVAQETDSVSVGFPVLIVTEENKEFTFRNVHQRSPPRSSNGKKIRICSHQGLWWQTQTGVSSTTRKGCIGLCCFSALISLQEQEGYSLIHPPGTLQCNQNRICIFQVQEVALFVLQPHRTSTTQTAQITPFTPLFLSDLNTLKVLRKPAESPV